MFDIFVAHLKENSSLTGEEIEQILTSSVTKRLRRRQYLLQDGEVCHYHCFVQKGCLRSYRVGEDGVEHIMRFAAPNSWISDQESFNNIIPSKNNIDALEDSELVLIEKEEFDQLISSIPNFRKFRDMLKDRSYDDNENRIMSNISDSVEKKYTDFIKFYPDIFNIIPLHMVASYLGVSRETLSRIRKQYVKA